MEETGTAGDQEANWDVGGRWKRQEPQATKRRTGTLVEETGTAGDQEANWDVGGRWKRQEPQATKR